MDSNTICCKHQSKHLFSHIFLLILQHCFISLGKVSIKKKTLKVMEFSIQILHHPLRWKKTYFFPHFLCVFIMFIITKFGENFEEMMDLVSFKMFRTKKLKSKSPTDSRDFCPDPPSNEKLKSSLFWMN